MTIFIPIAYPWDGDTRAQYESYLKNFRPFMIEAHKGPFNYYVSLFFGFLNHLKVAPSPLFWDYVQYLLLCEDIQYVT